MMRVPFLFCAALVAALLAPALPAQVATGDPSGAVGNGELPPPDPGTDYGYGFGLQLDKPLPRVGSAVTATILFYNLSEQDAFGSVPFGGLGCSYFLKVRDAAGRLVWNPRVPCPMAPDPAIAPIGPWPFPAGTVLRYDTPLPLKYLFSDTGDPDGANLPGGLYVLEAYHLFDGPQRNANVFELPGGHPSASVPFRISLCNAQTGTRDIRRLDQGMISGYRYGDPGFRGADLVFRTRQAFLQFWAQHNGNISPAPPAPEVDFRVEMVVAVLLGYQSSGGGSTEVTSVEELRCRVEVETQDTWLPGPLDGNTLPVVANPYDIVAVPRSMKEVLVQHLAEAPPPLPPPAP